MVLGAPLFPGVIGPVGFGALVPISTAGVFGTAPGPLGD